jgi:glyoxylase-like metal-dependent hydrolase (beta-lactamase superfamily II)
MPTPDTQPARSGKTAEISERVRRVTAANAGMMTGPGTNAYVVGREAAVVIDPGPDDPEHLARICAAARGPIEKIVVTHTHPDHSPGSRMLSQLTGAPVLAHPRRLQGERDEQFAADAHLNEGDVLEVGDCRLRCLYTPGHAADHLCYLLQEEGLLFAGDHVMEGTTVVIAPPDGDMQDYLLSLHRLKTEAVRDIAPGHGAVIKNPNEVLQEIIDHRMEREAQILTLLEEGGETSIAELVRRIYTHVPVTLHDMARMSVYAHLLKLRAEERVRGENLESSWRVLPR